MFNAVSSAAFIIPVILYLVIIGLIVWLAVRFVRSNERIADNTERIAKALSDRNRIERDGTIE
ncbi:MAG: hypothetical protein CL666_09145 [Balneola sp.]|nr:hypothetical protein [Balneola sp.]|tara:strand:+ start:3606 stop:3794 length:189 start_codon:yes stop_codon:yes gene_type:complete